MHFEDSIVYLGEISDRAVFFDVEGTLTPESLDTIAARFGVLDEVRSITAAGMGTADHLKAFKESVEKRLDLLLYQQATRPYVPLTEEYLCDLGKGIRLYKGAEKLIRQLKADGVSIILISGGLFPFVSEVAERISADAYICNMPLYRTGKDGNLLTGEIACYVDGNKDIIANYMIETHGIKNAAYIGDGSNDSAALSLGHVLGIAPRHAHDIAKKSADHILNTESLFEAYKIIKKNFSAGQAP